MPARAGTASPALPLEGIRVLALEASVSAPHCSRILGDMGAEVVKIEKPGEGDLVRHWDSAVRGLSSGYVWLNGNKKSVAIDLKNPAGRDIVERLAARSDVLLENFAPGVAERLGFGAPAMSALNPRLIYCSISGYGQDGPYRDVKAYDLLIQGEAGLIATTGSPEQPAKVSIPIVDLAASMYAVVGILLALFQREKTGRGQIIDISMLESVVSWLGYFPHFYWHRGEEPERVGMRHHFVTPYGPFLASDDVYVNFAVATAHDWEVFCREVIERPDLLADERFSSSEARRKHRQELELLVENTFAQKPHDEWFRRLERAKLPYGEVRSISQVLAHPQILARNFIQEMDSPVGPIPIIDSPLRLSGCVPRRDRIPALGEDTRAVLVSLGFSDEEIERLAAEKIIG